MTKGILWAVPVKPIDVSPRFPNVPKSPHITFKFGVERKDVEYILGCEFYVLIDREHWDDRLQALSARIPNVAWNLCDNVIPHLTVSWVDGAVPFESNAMLRGPNKSITLKKEQLFQMQFYEFQGQ